MKLADTLRMHDEALVSGGLPTSLGDSYLLRHNSVYRAIRERVAKEGFVCTTEDFCHYGVLPLAALDAILKERKIPYFDNVSVLREIENKSPGKFQVEELVHVKANYVLHEACHCLADTALRGVRPGAPGLSPEQRKALALMLAESFANAVEALANIPNTTPELRFFHESNSYIIHDRKTAAAFQHALDILGERNAYRLLFLAYLHSNYLTTLTPKQYPELIDSVLPPGEARRKAQDSPHVRKMVQYAFELSMAFREQTTGFYLAHAGIKGDARQLFRVDLLALYRDGDLVRDFLLATETVFP